MLAIKSDVYQVYQQLGYIHLGNKNYKVAMEYSRKAIGLKPDSSLAIYLMGRIYFEQKLYKKAID